MTPVVRLSDLLILFLNLSLLNKWEMRIKQPDNITFIWFQIIQWLTCSTIDENKQILLNRVGGDHGEESQEEAKTQESGQHEDVPDGSHDLLTISNASESVVMMILTE